MKIIFNINSKYGTVRREVDVYKSLLGGWSAVVNGKTIPITGDSLTLDMNLDIDFKLEDRGW
jgi:hypothetical protein